MKIAISVESTCDLTKQQIIDNDIKVIPYQINLGDKSFKDGEMSIEEMFDYVDNKGVHPKTTAINSFEYQEYFEQLRKDYDAVVHITLSSGITSSSGNAVVASKEVENVYVVDSQSLSTGIALLALYAKELADKGEQPQAIVQKLEERKKSLCVSFVIERLDYLHKGGRCSSIALLGANLLKIRPRIIVKDGKMISDKKYRGSMGGVMSKYAKELFGEFNTPDLSRVFITYTTATEEMLESCRNAVKEMGFKEVIETRAGVTIASHCGANTMGILYFNDGNK